MKRPLLIIPLVILLCFTYSCQQQVEEGIRRGEAIILLDSLMEIMNMENLALAEEIMDPDCVLRYPILPEPIVGIEAFKTMVKIIRFRFLNSMAKSKNSFCKETRFGVAI